jgi:hypothetical protein
MMKEGGFFSYGMEDESRMDFDVAPLDTYAERITMGIAFLGGILMLPILFAYISNMRWYGLFIPAVFALMLALFLTLTYAAQPTKYQIREHMLIVRRRWFRALKIPIASLTGTMLATPLAQLTQFRFAFNPGVFGYQGPFDLEPFGQVFFMATNRERLVAVSRFSAPPLILSPARPRAFIDGLTEHLIQLPETPTEPSQEL